MTIPKHRPTARDPAVGRGDFRTLPTFRLTVDRRAAENDAAGACQPAVVPSARRGRIVVCTRSVRFLALAVLLAAFPALADTCLPEVQVPAEWTACSADADCVLAGDGCRTCANWLPVNAKHRAAASAKDAEERAKAKCTMTCEACAPALVKLACEAGQCRARPAPTPKP